MAKFPVGELLQSPTAPAPSAREPQGKPADGPAFTNKADRAAIDEALGDDQLQMGDLREAFTLEDEDGEAIEDDELLFDGFDSEGDDYYDGEE